jgi:hypothetical protein
MLIRVVSGPPARSTIWEYRCKIPGQILVIFLCVFHAAFPTTKCQQLERRGREEILRRNIHIHPTTHALEPFLRDPPRPLANGILKKIEILNGDVPFPGVWVGSIGQLPFTPIRGLANKHYFCIVVLFDDFASVSLGK